jgi:hypothetical protein
MALFNQARICLAIACVNIMLTMLAASTQAQPFANVRSTYEAQPGSMQRSELSSLPFDQSELIAAQAAHAIKVEVTVVAPVKKLLPEDDRGLPHQKFLLELSNGTTILVAHDIAMANRVPIRPGDIVRIHGEYIWNGKGGLIHWTHHTDTPYHEGGWIDFAGVRYQ